MPILYTIIGPIKAKKYNKTSGFKANFTREQLREKIKELQGIKRIGTEEASYEYQRIDSLEIADHNHLIQTKVGMETTKPQAVKLPAFKTLAEAENAINELIQNSKHWLKEQSTSWYSHNETAQYFPVLIQISDRERLGLDEVTEFKYPHISVPDVNSSETNKHRSATQFIELTPPIQRTCILIDSQYLDVDDERNPRRPYQIISVAEPNNYFAVWHVKDEKQLNSYERCWKENNFLNETLANKVARMFKRYAHPVAERYKIPAISSNIVRNIENGLSLHPLRGHLELADEIAKQLESTACQSWDEATILNYLTKKFKEEKGKFVNSDKKSIEHLTSMFKKRSPTEFSLEGSFVSRLDFVTTQLSKGEIVEFANIITNNSESRDEVKYSSYMPS